MGRSHGARTKRLTYRDRIGRSQADHAQHWDGFVFEAGPVCVRAVGVWGEVQVWASSEEEGKRVIRHGLVFGGFDPDDPKDGEWVITRSRSPRYGQPGTYRTAVDRRGLRVSMRDGPDGAPIEEWPVERAFG